MNKKHYINIELYDKHLEFKFRYKWLFLIPNSFGWGLSTWAILVLLGLFENPSFIQALIFIFMGFLLSIWNLKSEKRRYLKRKAQNS